MSDRLEVRADSEEVVQALQAGSSSHSLALIFSVIVAAESVNSSMFTGNLLFVKAWDT